MFSTQQLKDIEQLQKECENHDHLQLKLNWEMLKKRESNQLDFLHYEKDGQAWIYGFSILPEHQGKGIGRKVLRRIIKDQSLAGRSLHLEVETKNNHALGLYVSVGFKAVHAQDYYTYQL